VIVDEFLDDCEDQHQELGLAVHEAIGYRYLPFSALADGISEHAEFSMDESYLIRTGRPLLNVAGSREYIRAECGFNHLDGSQQVDEEAIWARFEPRIRTLGGMSVNTVLRVVSLRREPRAGDPR
jgi:hypothetical protein